LFDKYSPISEGDKMNSFEDRLPRNKFDFERVNKIKNMKKKDVIPILPGLLEWIQDMNWAIAPEVAEILLSFPKENSSYN
jgi:hypothetical protein